MPSVEYRLFSASDRTMRSGSTQSTATIQPQSVFEQTLIHFSNRALSSEYRARVAAGILAEAGFRNTSIAVPITNLHISPDQQSWMLHTQYGKGVDIRVLHSVTNPNAVQIVGTQTFARLRHDEFAPIRAWRDTQHPEQRSLFDFEIPFARFFEIANLPSHILSIAP